MSDMKDKMINESFDMVKECLLDGNSQTTYTVGDARSKPFSVEDLKRLADEMKPPLIMPGDFVFVSLDDYALNGDKVEYLERYTGNVWVDLDVKMGEIKVLRKKTIEPYLVPFESPKVNTVASTGLYVSTPVVMPMDYVLKITV